MMIFVTRLEKVPAKGYIKGDFSVEKRSSLMILRRAIIGIFLTMNSWNANAETAFITASKPMCTEVVRSVKGHISYDDSMKSGDLGFHHCIHHKLTSRDFPQSDPDRPGCRQLDLTPQVVSIYPPLPHEDNPNLPVFGRPNPYYAPAGEACEVKYSQAYFHP
jgi:hypothetical protein